MDPDARELLDLAEAIDKVIRSYLINGGTVRKAVGMLANRLGELTRANYRTLPEREELLDLILQCVEKKIYKDDYIL
jgi:hypothetical protein